MRVCNPAVCAWNKLSRAREGPDAVLGIVDHLRRRFARFKLCAHFLDLRCLLRWGGLGVVGVGVGVGLLRRD